MSEQVTEPTQEEILQEMVDMNSEPGVGVGEVKVTPIDRIPEPPTGDEPVQLTEEQKEDLANRIRSAQKELNDFIQYLQSKYSTADIEVALTMNMGFQATLKK